MDTPRSSYPTFSWTARRHLLRALAQAHDARLYRRLRAAVAEIAEGKPVAVVARHARVERSTVYRWIERYLAERAPCSLADGKRSGRPRMTPALTHAVQQILVRVPVAAHLATYLAFLSLLDGRIPEVYCCQWPRIPRLLIRPGSSWRMVTATHVALHEA